MNVLNPFGANANLARIARRYVWAAPAITVLSILTGLFEGVGISLLMPFLSTLTHTAATPSNGALALVNRFAQGYSRNGRLLLIAGAILLSSVLKNLFRTVQNAYAAWVDGRVGDDIRCALSARLEGVGYAFFLVQDPSRLANILTSESWKASAAVRAVLSRIAAGAATAVFGIMLFIVSWRLSLMVLVGGLAARAAQKYLEGRLTELSHRTVSAKNALADRMLFSVFGARVVRLFNHQQAEHARFAQTSNDVRRVILRVEAVAGTISPLLEALHGLLFVTVMMFAVLTGDSLPVLAAFLVLMNRLQPHLRALEQSGTEFASAAGQLTEVEWLLSDADKPAAPVGHLPYPGLRDTIEFDHVTFGYQVAGAEPALTNACFQLRRGRATALIGESGAGKSTVINLLCRLLEPSLGAIRVDGQPLAEYRVDEWLAGISIAGQDIDLIDGTIAENIAYSLPTIDRERIQAAARLAKADFIEDLPLGLDAFVGPRGLNLSGGQRQRIGLARALARQPQILILDEATNAIDYETENAIIKTLVELKKCMTIVVISHRPGTLAFCDDAVVLCNGRVLESGPLDSTAGYQAMRAGSGELSVTYAATAEKS